MFLPSSHRLWGRLGRILSLLVGWQPFTVRGIVAVVLSYLALSQFAYPEHDLVANVLGTALLSLLGLVVISALLVRIWLGSRLRAAAHFDTGNALSQSPVGAGIVLENCNLPPFFSLRVARVFRHPGVYSRNHLIRGGLARGLKRQLIDEVWFPHRGLWSLDALSFTLNDALGFVSLSWISPLDISLEVSAKNLPIRHLPIVASSIRSGDELNLSDKRAGDPYDLKPYDPSDGIKRILWKAFAHSRELVVRRAEPAVIPEGEISLYLVAAREDDHVAGAAQYFIDLLMERNIVVLFGTDEVRPDWTLDEAYLRVAEGQRPFGGVYREQDEIRAAINSSVWHKSAGTGSGFETYLETLETQGRMIRHGVVFGPQRSGWYESVAAAARLRGIKLTVALVPDTLDPAVELKVRLAKKKEASIEKIAERFSAGRFKRIRRRFPGLLALSPSGFKSLAAVSAEFSRGDSEVLICETGESVSL